MTDTELGPELGAAPPPPRWRALLRWLILVSGLAGLALVAHQATTADESPFPAIWVLVASFALQAGAGAAAARAWSTLLGPQVDGRRVRGAMYESQLSKYVPGGGVLQAAGQVALSTSEGVSTRRSAVTWVTSIVLTIVAGLVLMGSLSLAGGFEGWRRLIAVLGLLSIVAVDRRVLAWVLHQGHRLSRRIPEPELLPSERQLVIGFLWILVGFVLIALSFTIILVELDSSVRPLAVLPAYVAGWLAGFLLVPLPAGLGVREAILVALIPGSTTGLLVSASLSQRVMTFAAEVTLVAGHRLAQWRANRPRP